MLPYIIGVLVILYFLSHDNTNKKIYNHPHETNFSSDMTKKERGFIKPEHKLFDVLSKMSSGNKISLTGICESYIYTKNTLPSELQDDVLQLINYVLSTLNIISSSNYHIKEIENVYIQKDSNNNQRYGK